jgi:hypothetical protein
MIAAIAAGKTAALASTPAERQARADGRWLREFIRAAQYYKTTGQQYSTRVTAESILLNAIFGGSK